MEIERPKTPERSFVKIDDGSGWVSVDDAFTKTGIEEREKERVLNC